MGIGLRRRYFFIILATLGITVLIVSILQEVYFTRERVRLLDQRLSTVAASLLASGLSLDLIDNLESTDNLIGDLLGDERADLLISVYNLEGEVLAQNLTATELSPKFSKHAGFEDQAVQGRSVRVLNFSAPELIIQVGAVLHSTVKRTHLLFNQRLIYLLIPITVVLILSSYIGSQVLFSPLRRLSGDFQSMSQQLAHRLGQPLSGFNVGSEFASLSSSNKTGWPRDEFAELCRQIDSFLRNLARYGSSLNAQTALLTHELKTPLTIIRNHLAESASDRNGWVGAAPCIAEVDRLTHLINDFSQWSVLVSSPGGKSEIFAVKLEHIVAAKIEQLNKLYEGRIRLQRNEACTVFALPVHVEQVVTNLLINAIKYSQGEIVCQLAGGVLQVSDAGSGFPEHVLRQLGQPFNRGENGTNSGSGLGLAWIKALSDRYDWELDIVSSNQGSQVSLDFARADQANQTEVAT